MTNWLTGLPGNDLFGGETSATCSCFSSCCFKQSNPAASNQRSISLSWTRDFFPGDYCPSEGIFRRFSFYIQIGETNIYFTIWIEGGITQTEICCEITSTCTEGKLENKFFVCSIVCCVTSGISCQVQVFICQLSRVLQLPWSWDLPQSSRPFALMSVYSWLHWLVIAAHLNNTTLKHA